MAFVTEVFTARGTVAGRLIRLARALSAWARSNAARRATIRELSALSDRALDDVGIRRDDIVHIARDSARRPGAPV